MNLTTTHQNSFHNHQPSITPPNTCSNTYIHTEMATWTLSVFYKDSWTGKAVNVVWGGKHVFWAVLPGSCLQPWYLLRSFKCHFGLCRTWQRDQHCSDALRACVGPEVRAAGSARLWQGVQCNGELAAIWETAFLPPFLKDCLWHLQKFISANTG